VYSCVFNEPQPLNLCRKRTTATCRILFCRQLCSVIRLYTTLQHLLNSSCLWCVRCPAAAWTVFSRVLYVINLLSRLIVSRVLLLLPQPQNSTHLVAGDVDGHRGCREYLLDWPAGRRGAPLRYLSAQLITDHQRSWGVSLPPMTIALMFHQLREMPIQHCTNRPTVCRIWRVIYIEVRTGANKN